MAVMERDTELSLVVGLRRGEPEAFDAVYEAHRAHVFGFLVRLSQSRTLAEDLLAETWLRLVRHAARLQPDTRVLPWLLTVARNLYWSYRRTSALEETMDPLEMAQRPCGEGWPTPFEVVARHESRRRLERGLARLSPRHREVLLLVGVEGLTPGDAARVCDVTPEALRQLLSRARTALARAIDVPRGRGLERRRAR